MEQLLSARCYGEIEWKKQNREYNIYSHTKWLCWWRRDDNLELEMLNLPAGCGSRVSGANISWCPLFLSPTPSNSFFPPILLGICLKLEGRFSCQCHKTLYTEGPHHRCVWSNSKVAYTQTPPNIGSSQHMTLNTSPSREKKKIARPQARSQYWKLPLAVEVFASSSCFLCLLR